MEAVMTVMNSLKNRSGKARNRAIFAGHDLDYIKAGL